MDFSDSVEPLDKASWNSTYPWLRVSKRLTFKQMPLIVYTIWFRISFTWSNIEASVNLLPQIGLQKGKRLILEAEAGLDVQSVSEGAQLQDRLQVAEQDIKGQRGHVWKPWKRESPVFGGGRKEFSESLTGTRKDLAVVFGKQTGQMEVVQASLSILQSPQPTIETRKTLSQFCGGRYIKAPTHQLHPVHPSRIPMKGELKNWYAEKGGQGRWHHWVALGSGSNLVLLFSSTLVATPSGNILDSDSRGMLPRLFHNVGLGKIVDALQLSLQSPLLPCTVFLILSSFCFKPSPSRIALILCKEWCSQGQVI